MDEAQAKSIEDRIILIKDAEAQEVLQDLYKLTLKLKDISDKQHIQLKQAMSNLSYWETEAKESLGALRNLRDNHEILRSEFRDLSFKHAEFVKQFTGEAPKEVTVKTSTFKTGAWAKVKYDEFNLNPWANIIPIPAEGQN
jgi:hypothetical protein